MVPTPYGMVRLSRTAFVRAWDLPRSAFYRPFLAAPRRGDLRLVAVIKDVLIKHPRYGYRQVAHRLRRGRFMVNPKRVLRLMRTHDLLVKPLRRPKWRRSKSVAGDLPNLSKVATSAPDQVWFTDFTYVPLRSRWVYLSVIIDAFSRRCVGWALGSSITTDLALEALRMALVSRRPRGTLVHHSDRGSQYGGVRYQDLLLENGMQQSFSRPATPTDNPKCERFIGTLKREEIWVRPYVDFEDARQSITAFINDYNLDRSHSSLGKRSPIEFERIHRQAALSQPRQAELSVS